MPRIEQSACELMLPVPFWAQEGMLINFVSLQREEMAERIFGHTYDLRVDIDLILDRNLDDSKGKGKGIMRKRFLNRVRDVLNRVTTF